MNDRHSQLMRELNRERITREQAISEGAVPAWGCFNTGQERYGCACAECRPQLANAAAVLMYGRGETVVNGYPQVDFKLSLPSLDGAEDEPEEGTQAMNRIHWPVEARRVDNRKRVWLLVLLGAALLLVTLFLLGRFL